MPAPIIDEEFKAVLPPLDAEELAGLERMILAEGCRDPLVTWRGILIDGHNRLAICQRHSLPFNTVERDFASREEVRIWMRETQSSRRNLNAAWRIELALASKADLAKIGKQNMQAGGGDKKSANAKSGLSSVDKPVNEPRHDTRAEVAAKAGVGTATVARAEVVRREAPELWEQAKAGETTVSAAYTQTTKRPHVTNNSGENEWYTPPDLIERARAAMGGIDLDPASSEIANMTVMAGEFFTKDNDGLNAKWHGRIWLNPPYAQPLIGQFCEAAAKAYTNGDIAAACILTNNATETKWLQMLFSVSSAVCFIRGRIRFLDVTGNPALSPLQGQCVSYLGPEPKRFSEAFREIGECWIRE